MSNNSNSKGGWNWEVSGFEPRKSPSSSTASAPPLSRRYSISTPSIVPNSELISKQSVVTKLHSLKDKVKEV
ncbi:hypothetical protein Tco_1431893, partial [Tanacetum coccineum]